MDSRALYRKYRRLIGELAAEQGLTEPATTSLLGLLQQFQRESATLQPATVHFLCEELAGQFEHEALLSIDHQRRDVMIAAVKGFDDMALATVKV